MTETKPEWEPTGLERFGHLEDKILRVAEAFKAIRKENDLLRTENKELRGELESLRSSRESADKSLIQLQREREELRERVEKALGHLASLELQ